MKHTDLPENIFEKDKVLLMGQSELVKVSVWRPRRAARNEPQERPHPARLCRCTYENLKEKAVETKPQIEEKPETAPSDNFDTDDLSAAIDAELAKQKE